MPNFMFADSTGEISISESSRGRKITPVFWQSQGMAWDGSIKVLDHDVKEHYINTRLHLGHCDETAWQNFWDFIYNSKVNGLEEWFLYQPETASQFFGRGLIPGASFYTTYTTNGGSIAKDDTISKIDDGSYTDYEVTFLSASPKYIRLKPLNYVVWETATTWTLYKDAISTIIVDMDAAWYPVRFTKIPIESPEIYREQFVPIQMRIVQTEVQL